MKPLERRLIVDHTFDGTLDLVIVGFLQEGFTVVPFGAGDLRHDLTSGNPLRHAVLEAVAAGDHRVAGAEGRRAAQLPRSGLRARRRLHSRHCGDA